jgi:hypothetical protein
MDRASGPVDAVEECMTTTPYSISRYPEPDLADIPEDIRERILAVQEKSGFIPNVFLVLARRPGRV